MNTSLRALTAGLFRFALALSIALVLLIGTAWIAAQFAGWIRNEDGDSPLFLVLGAICSLVFWLFVAVFHLRNETQTVPLTQRKQFILKTKTVLQEMGYTLTSHRAHMLVFWPNFHSYLFGGGIQVDASEQEAKLTGPKVLLDLFRRNFRLMNHVQRVQQYIDSHRKFTETMLKRVELQIRLEPEQLEPVRANIIKMLQKEGVVICELNILVQSDRGIHENLIEIQVRDWLEKNQIDCDIHKDVIQFVEVVEPQLESDKVCL